MSIPARTLQLAQSSKKGKAGADPGFFQRGGCKFGRKANIPGQRKWGRGRGRVGRISGMFEYVDFSFILMPEEFLGTISNGNRTDWSTIQGVISE